MHPSNSGSDRGSGPHVVIPLIDLVSIARLPNHAAWLLATAHELVDSKHRSFSHYSVFSLLCIDINIKTTLRLKDKIILSLIQPCSLG